MRCACVYIGHSDWHGKRNPQVKKLVVTIHTFERCKVDKDLAMNTTMWLTNDKMTTNHECVDVPKCLWCIRFTVYF